MKIKCPYCGNESVECYDIGYVDYLDDTKEYVIETKYSCFDCDPDDGKEFTVIYAPVRIK